MKKTLLFLTVLLLISVSPVIAESKFVSDYRAGDVLKYITDTIKSNGKSVYGIDKCDQGLDTYGYESYFCPLTDRVIVYFFTRNSNSNPEAISIARNDYFEDKSKANDVFIAAETALLEFYFSSFRALTIGLEIASKEGQILKKNDIYVLHNIYEDQGIQSVTVMDPAYYQALRQGERY